VCVLVVGIFVYLLCFFIDVCVNITTVPYVLLCCAGLLIEQLTKGTYECMICYNVVKRETAVWNCSNCYHIYHLYCIKRWANSSKLNDDSGGGNNGWRCPACQNVTTSFPNAYLCFCGMFFLLKLSSFLAFCNFFNN